MYQGHTCAVTYLQINERPLRAQMLVKQLHQLINCDVVTGEIEALSLVFLRAFKYCSYAASQTIDVYQIKWFIQHGDS